MNENASQSQSQMDKDVVKLVVHALYCLRFPVSFARPGVTAPYLAENIVFLQKGRW
jgi:hypothetical protein